MADDVRSEGTEGELFKDLRAEEVEDEVREAPLFSFHGPPVKNTEFSHWPGVIDRFPLSMAGNGRSENLSFGRACWYATIVSCLKLQFRLTGDQNRKPVLELSRTRRDAAVVDEDSVLQGSCDHVVSLRSLRIFE